MEKKPKNIFIQGPVLPNFIAESIAHHSHKTGIGAHSIFLGQVRADVLPGGIVEAIDYSAYEELALEKAHQIREEAFRLFPLHCLHIHHSLGRVAAGENSLFVFASSTHRKDAQEATAWLVDALKKELPVWGKEILTSGGHQWKQNT
jgi:molybdopterin synthase catalytic subunit